MKEAENMKVFDLHCDSLTCAMIHSSDMAEKHLDISIDECKNEEYCQCFAVFCPDTIRGEDAWNYYTMAHHYFKNQLLKYGDLISQSKCFDDIEKSFDNHRISAILTVEGGAVIAGNINNLDRLYEDGVRVMTLTWNGENEIGCGSSDQDACLTEFGKETVRRMNEIGMTVDVSHLSDRGFWDVSEISEKPFIATHSNLRKVCGHRRNLTDKEFEEIVSRKGIVGINFYKDFLNDDGNNSSLDDIVSNVLAMLDLGGEDVIALGSDYDGCEVVPGIERHPDLYRLYDKMTESDIDERIIEKIFWKNASDFFERNM